MKTRQQLRTEIQQKKLIIQQFKRIIDQNNQRIKRNKQIIKLLKDQSFNHLAEKLQENNQITGIGQTPKHQQRFKYIKPGKYLYYSPE